MAKNPETRIHIGPGESLSDRFEQMRRAWQELAREIDEAFSGDEYRDAVQGLTDLGKYTQKFSGQLAYLRLSLGRLKAAFQTAFAPIGAYVLPLVNRAINGLATFLNTVGAVLSAVMDAVFGTDSLAESTDKAAKSYKSLGTSARRSLAGFDQLQRLNGGTGSSAEADTDEGSLTRLTYRMREIVAQILHLLQPLREIDLTPLKTALQNLWAAAKPALEQLGSALSWLWQAVAAPFITWCAEKLLPALTDAFAGGLTAVTGATGPLISGIQMLQNALRPVVEFIQNAICGALENFKNIFGELGAQLSEKSPEIQSIFLGISQVITRVWEVVGPIFKALLAQFHETFGGLGTVAAKAFGAVLEGLAGISEFLLGAFTGDWNRAWNGLLYSFKGMVNSLIGLLNSLLIKLTGALNGVVRLVNAMSFTVPSWVPGIGGEKFGFGLKTLTAPQIPYLAQGAVLPANRPFLAMVGDQRHGTNIEAPLATIQEAVGQVMGDYASGNMAGHEATVSVLRQILEAVLGLEISDSAIASAASRYGTKMTLVRGGSL